MTEYVSLQRNGLVATILLKRPDAYNALNEKMRLQLAQAVAEVEADATLRVVVIAGVGRGFCAGADIKSRSAKTSGEVLEEEFRPCLAPIWSSDKIYISAVHGYAAGIGAAITLACDLIVMEKTAKLALAFAAIGLIPDGGLCWHLTRALGSRRALEAIVEGQSLDAELCAKTGLANRITDPGDALATAQTWAATIADAAPLAVSTAKRLVAQSDQMDINDIFSSEAKEQTRLAQSKDHDRGVAAFLGRETPVFKGS